MYFHDLGKYYQDEVLLAARDKALNKLAEMQFSDTGYSKLDGAFQGGPCDGLPTTGGVSMNIRTTSYALVALWKVESDLEDVWLGGNNKPFVDPLKKGTHTLVW